MDKPVGKIHRVPVETNVEILPPAERVLAAGERVLADPHASADAKLVAQTFISQSKSLGVALEHLRPAGMQTVRSSAGMDG